MEDILCDINWEVPFGSGEACEPQQAGVVRRGVILNRFAVNSVVQTPYDSANPSTSGVITDIDMDTGKKGVLFFAINKTLDINSNVSLNDNGNKVLDENIKGRGTLTSEQLGWCEAHLGKDVIFIAEDSEGDLWASGHSGGTQLNSYNTSFGVDSNGVRGIEFNFNNTSGAQMRKIVPNSATYSDVYDFLEVLTTAAA